MKNMMEKRLVDGAPYEKSINPRDAVQRESRRFYESLTPDPSENAKQLRVPDTPEEVRDELIIIRKHREVSFDHLHRSNRREADYTQLLQQSIDLSWQMNLLEGIICLVDKCMVPFEILQKQIFTMQMFDQFADVYRRLEMLERLRKIQEGCREFVTEVMQNGGPPAEYIRSRQQKEVPQS